MNKLWLKSYFLINYIETRLFNLFIKVLKSDSIETALESYKEFLIELDDRDFSNCIKDELYMKKFSDSELVILNELIKIDLKKELQSRFSDSADILSDLPEYKNSNIILTKDDVKIRNPLRTFVFEDNIIKPVDMVEPLRFSDLKGYDYNKKILYENTKALIEGKKANNILLYGDAGCGKSTSVRALLNEFSDISIVQIFKGDLINLDKLYEILKNKPQKFIIFADDISFDENDDSLSTMKAVIEGSLVQCPNNSVIYATTNRRHLVKESFQARKGDEIHLNDTLNEISSLSERFGINLLYAKPTNSEFVDIVLKIANDYKLDISQEELIKKAQRQALVKASTSPRTARQIVEILKTGMDI